MKKLMQTSSRSVIAFAALASAPLTMISEAIAQDDEIIVTATRRAQSIQDVPYNISAVTGDELARQGIDDVSGFIRTIPGAVFVDHGARSGINNSNLILRGINAEATSRNTSALVTAPVVSTYINETPIFVNLRLKDLERVEVLRGPQGTLYGSGSLGGSVRYIYNKPRLGEFSGSVSGEIGSTRSAGDPNYEIDAVLNVPLGDSLAFRVSGGYVSNGGFIDQPTAFVRDARGAPVLDNGSTDPFGDSAAFFAGQPVFVRLNDVNDEEIYYARAALYFEPTDRFNVTASYHRQEDTSGGIQAISPNLFGDELQTGTLIDEPFERDVDVAALEAEFDMGFATFTGSGSYYKSQGEGRRDFSSLYQQFDFFESAYGTSPRPLIEDFNSFEDSAFVFEARLASNSDDGAFLDWIVGAFYFDQDFNSATEDSFFGYDDFSVACFIETGTFGGAPCGFGTLNGIQATNGPLPIVQDLAFVIRQDSEFQDFALFGEVTLHFTDRWQVTGGIRYFDQSFSSTQVGGLLFAPGGVDTASLSTSESDVLFKVNSSYSISDNLNAYFTWSEGFRRGGVNALPNTVFGAAVNTDALTYGSDRVENRELGIKGSIGDGGPRFTLAYFNVDWSDVQINTQCTALSLLCAVNAGDANSQGIEFEIQGNLSEAIDVNVGYTYLDTDLQTLSQNVLDFNADGTLFADLNPNQSLPGAATHALFLGGNYTQPISSQHNLIFGANASYRSSANSTLETALNQRVDGFWLVDMSVALEADEWVLRAFVNNVTDDRGIIAADSVAQFGASANAFISTPRTFGLSATYRFGG